MREELDFFKNGITDNINGLTTAIATMNSNLNTIYLKVDKCLSSNAETADRVTSLELKVQEIVYNEETSGSNIEILSRRSGGSSQKT